MWFNYYCGVEEMLEGELDDLSIQTSMTGFDGSLNNNKNNIVDLELNNVTADYQQKKTLQEEIGII